MVTQAHIDYIWNSSEIITTVAFDKCLIMAVRLPNGFILTESSACVDPKDFDYKVGSEFCKERIINRLWELEGYLAQDKTTYNYDLAEEFVNE